MNCKNIKTLSKKINRNNYLSSLYLIVLVLTLTALFCVAPFLIKGSISGNFVVYSVTFTLISVGYYILLTVYTVGETAWYSGRLTKRKNNRKRFIFWLAPKHAFKALRLKTLLYLIKLTVTLAMTSPALLTFAFAIVLAFTGGIEVSVFIVLISGGATLMLAGLIFAFIFNQRFFLAEYLISDNPRLGAFQVIRQSKNLTEGHLHYIVKFKLSFIPWLFASLLILPVFYFYPYYKQSSCIIAKELRL